MASSIPELALNSSLLGTPLANASLSSNIHLSNVSLADATNATLSEAGLSSLLGLIYAQRHYISVQGRLFALTLAIIYISAHSALHRPFSAAPRKDESDEVADADDDASDGRTRRSRRRRRRRQRRSATSAAKEGISAYEAVMMPFVAGLALTGMYYVLQYLDDPLLLSRIMRAYSSVVGVASTGKLIGDGLHVATSLVFPNVWSRRGGGGAAAASRLTVFHVDPVRRCQLSQHGPVPDGSSPDSWAVDTTRTSPFPDRLAWLARTPSSSATAWTLRRIVREEWSVRVAVLGVGDAELGVTLSTIVGIAVSAGLAAAYCFTSASSAPALNNLLGLGFCYGALLIVSCTTFGIGSLVLIGLFVYDIVMVFYTPFMVTVATSIDAPIKLVASSGSRSSILGLGDIVVPGIFISMCLRYDLHRFYARQIQKVPTALETETVAPALPPTEGAPTAGASTAKDATATTTAITTKSREVKAAFIEPAGRWGDFLWTMGLWGALSSSVSPTPGLRAATFPKPLFHTAMVAYFVGLLLAVSTMLYTRQGQPALLYLVPAILLATWGRSLAAGELKDMWAYTEDESADVKDVVVEMGPDGKPVEKREGAKDGKGDKEDGEKGEDNDDDDEGHEVLLFSLQAPSQATIGEMDVI